jgi:hypothetical protein
LRDDGDCQNRIEAPEWASHRCAPTSVLHVQATYGTSLRTFSNPRLAATRQPPIFPASAKGKVIEGPVPKTGGFFRKQAPEALCSYRK